MARATAARTADPGLLAELQPMPYARRVSTNQDTESLQGRVAIVTGASSGIGQAVARELAGSGARVLVTARREERLTELAEQIGGMSVGGDILDPALPDRLIERACRELGDVDIVVNNAGVIEVGPVATIDIDRVCEMVRVNVEAAFRLAYCAVRHFQQRGRGHLVNVSSVMGTKVRPTAGAYSGTKYALEALSEALRMELAKTDVQVSCVEPGLVLTELHQRWPVHPTESMEIPTPLQPEDVARCVRFLLTQPSHVRIPRLMVLPGEHVV